MKFSNLLLAGAALAALTAGAVTHSAARAEDAPGIGLKVPDGLRALPTLAALRELAGDWRLRALEIVEYIPDFDRDHQTARLVRDLILALLAPVPALADTAGMMRR